MSGPRAYDPEFIAARSSTAGAPPRDRYSAPSVPYGYPPAGTTHHAGTPSTSASQPYMSESNQGDKRKREATRDPDFYDDDDEFGSQHRGGGAGGGPEAEEDHKPKKKPKGRAVLSCGECKRRKVKCDRKIPCATCIARGQPEKCAWEDPLARPEGQPFALASQYEEVIARLDRIESFLDSLPSDIRNQAIKAGSVPPPGQSHFDAAPSPTKLDGDLGASVSHSMQVTAPSPAGLDFLASAIEMVPCSRPRPQPANPQQHVEPTRAETSIVALPMRFEGPTKAVSHGLDLCFSESEMLDQRDRVLGKIYGLLPTSALAHQLVMAYFEDVSWFYSILHPPAFLAEFERFEEMLMSGRHYQVDVAWLGIFFAVLSLGLDGAQSLQIDSLPLKSKAETSAAWYAASLRLFHMSNWPDKPQFRQVQLVALYGQLNLTSGGGTDMGGFMSYLAIGIRIAQKLRLHQLGTDPQTMPPDDIAYPKGKNSVKRQTAIRVWGIIAFLDIVTANNKVGAYLVNPTQVTTPPPENLNFEQLSTTDWRTEPAPRHVWTDTTLELNKGGGGRYMRLVFDRLVTHAKDFTYDTVLELDREMRAHLATFPESMSAENVQREENNPKLRKQRFMSMSGAFSRLVRLHRPFFVTGLTSSKYRFSTDACLQAARKVITAHSLGKEPLKNIRIVHSATLSAAIVIYAYMFHLIDTNAPISDIAREKETAAAAYTVFSTTQATSPKLNKVLKHAVAILSLLAATVEQRQTQKSHRITPMESFAQVLRRIAKELSLAQPSAADTKPSPHSLVPPTPAATSPALSTAASEVTYRASISASTPASSIFQQSPQLLERKMSTVDSTLPSPSPLPSMPLCTGSPPDPGFAAMFLGDLGLSSNMRPGPDVYDLSWLTESPGAPSPTRYDPIERTSTPQLFHPTNNACSSVSPYYPTSNSPSLVPNDSLSSSNAGGGGFVKRPYSQSPRLPSKAWFRDGSEGADALYSAIK
ncbi:uncharacterized protein JCM15063_005540 [Sporobolomyces koalae]|uniref:uncharacterized protein n=1 Tax=Sporobolomyces koalae TaxID=500713 RepID=UPI00317DD740